MGEKEQRTNEQYAWVNSKCKKRSYVTLCIPLCICRLTLAWISSKISTKLLGMPTHLDRSSLTALDPISSDLSLLLSSDDWPLASPFANCFLWVPLSNSNWLSLTHSRSRRDRRLRPLLGFAPKQTKGSSAWRTTYKVLQLYISLSRTDTGLCIYHFAVWTNFNFLHNSQWIVFPNQSCLILVFFALVCYIRYVISRFVFVST